MNSAAQLARPTAQEFPCRLCSFQHHIEAGRTSSIKKANILDRCQSSTSATLTSQRRNTFQESEEHADKTMAAEQVYNALPGQLRTHSLEELYRLQEFLQRQGLPLSQAEGQRSQSCAAGSGAGARAAAPSQQCVQRPRVPGPWKEQRQMPQVQPPVWPCLSQRCNSIRTVEGRKYVEAACRIGRKQTCGETSNITAIRCTCCAGC
mmetsp:Transcript_121018/g.214065  ORF Transcript_121018/g.214065 Transcript_121018/m.214065 type:complete len:206 (+) Transcript_121018:268-885(+)